MSFFSIIIPTYNREAFLNKAIKSVLTQTFQDWELIIVDDGSTDNTKEVVGQYKDDRIKYIYQENAERSVARNNGIRIAKGEYVCFLDSDDYYDEDYLEVLSQEITRTNNQVAVYSTGYKIIDNKNIKNINPLPSGNNIIEYLLKNKSVVSVSQCVTHSEILKKYIFDQNLSLWEDTHLFFRIFSEYSCYSIKKFPVNIITHEDSTVYHNTYNVKINNVIKYIDAIKDVQDFYANVSKKYDQLFEKYKFSKIQMYIYSARMNCQYNLVNVLLTKYFVNYISPKNIFYFIVTFIKNNFSFITGIKIK